jgi:hypothetical protein
VAIATLLIVFETPFSNTVNIEAVGNGLASKVSLYVNTTVVPAAVFVAETNVGGIRVGVTEFDATDDVDDLSPLFAIAVNVYVVPFVKPVTLQLPDAPVTVQVPPPGVAVTVKLVGVGPELDVTFTVACLSPAVAVGAVGTSGASNSGVNRFTHGDADNPTTIFWSLG